MKPCSSSSNKRYKRKKSGSGKIINGARNVSLKIDVRDRKLRSENRLSCRKNSPALFMVSFPSYNAAAHSMNVHGVFVVVAYNKEGLVVMERGVDTQRTRIAMGVLDDGVVCRSLIIVDSIAGTLAKNDYCATNHRCSFSCPFTRFACRGRVIVI
jgi:hypothetical protein